MRERRGVVVVGPGRVGTLLVAALTRAGHRVAGVAGGGEESRRRVESLVAGVRTAHDPAELVPNAQTVLIATPDDAIETVVTGLVAADALVEDQRVAHLSGAHGLEVLHAAELAGCRTAACHPAQTVPAGSIDPDLLVGVAWGVTCREPDQDWAAALVESLGGDVHFVPNDRRRLYHAALTVASNTVGAAVAVARQMLLAAQVTEVEPFLGPLVRSSATNVMAAGATALTGPLVRGDLGTIRSHLEQLDSDLPRLAEAYRHLSLVLLDQVAPGQDAQLTAQLRSLLSDEPDST